MENKLQLVVNLWYKEWLTTHDPYDDDFELELEKVGLRDEFTLSFNPNTGSEWLQIR